MQGDGKAQSGQAGILQLVASDLFRFMRQGEASKREFVVKVSYFEIYNEKIRDLLSGHVRSPTLDETPEKKRLNTPSCSLNPDDPITIRTNGDGEIVVNVVQNEVSNVDEVLELLVHGNSQRVVAVTDMNTHSSRSHAVFRLSVESRDMDDSMNLAEQGVVRVSDFNLVDLAGSESLKQTNNSGARQREGASINKRYGLAFATRFAN
jgi:centromeric protein E